MISFLCPKIENIALDDVLQPPGHGFYQVPQGRRWVNFELGAVLYKYCHKKVFKLRAIKFDQNMHTIHTDTKEKTLGLWAQKILPSNKGSFFLVKKFAKQTVSVSGQHKFARISQSVSHTHQKNLKALPLIRRLQWKYLQVSRYLVRTVHLKRPGYSFQFFQTFLICTTEIAVFISFLLLISVRRVF